MNIKFHPQLHEFQGNARIPIVVRIRTLKFYLPACEFRIGKQSGVIGLFRFSKIYEGCTSKGRNLIGRREIWILRM